METLKMRVRAIMREYPETRDNDSLLFLKLLIKKFAVEPTTPLGAIDFTELPSFASVVRRRQEIQNLEHVLIPRTPNVLEARGFYQLCPRELLQYEDLDSNYLDGVCRKCKVSEKYDPEECPLCLERPQPYYSPSGSI